MTANIAARLQDLARTQGGRLALVDDSGGRVRRVSYEELAARAAAFAAGLAARGVARGDRVLLLLPMSVELYVVLLGCSHLGAAAVFLDAWSDRRRVDASLRAARPRAFVGVPLAQAFRLVSPAFRAVPLHLPVGRGFPLERLERPGQAVSPADVAPEEPALVTFTTGTTGAPKAAARSHAFLWAQHRALTAHLRPERWDVDMPVLPIFVLNNLAGGLTTVLPDFDPRRPDRFVPRKVRAQMDREGVVTASGSPAFFDRIAQAGLRLPLRSLFVGGAPVLPPQARRLQDATAGLVHVVYGSTEAEPISGLTVPELLEARGEGLCVGRPVPEVAVRLAPVTDGPLPDASEVPPGEVGEVLVSGEHVLSGYLDNPEEDRRHKVRADGRIWHRTGDGARRDEGGRLWLQGRLSGRIQRAGRTWWEMPSVVRAVEWPGVTHAALVPRGQRGVLVLECPGSRPAAWPPLEPPADRLVVLREIPRDARHRSRTDHAALAERFRRRPGLAVWLALRSELHTAALPVVAYQLLYRSWTRLLTRADVWSPRHARAVLRLWMSEIALLLPLWALERGMPDLPEAAPNLLSLPVLVAWPTFSGREPREESRRELVALAREVRAACRSLGGSEAFRGIAARIRAVEEREGAFLSSTMALVEMMDRMDRAVRAGYPPEALRGPARLVALLFPPTAAADLEALSEESGLLPADLRDSWWEAGTPEESPLTPENPDV